MIWVRRVSLVIPDTYPKKPQFRGLPTPFLRNFENNGKNSPIITNSYATVFGIGFA
jgi:hypothetical protein